MSSWPGGITATTLFVEDLEAANEFYDRAVGLPVYYQDPGGHVWEIAH